MRWQILLSIWGILLFTMVDGACTHFEGRALPSIAMVPGVCIEDLSGTIIDQLKFTLVMDELYIQWEEAYPKDFDRVAAERFLEGNPFTVYIVNGSIMCSHANPGTWPGQPGHCYGLWPVRAQHIFLDREGGHIPCKGIAHEFSHVFAYHFLGDGDLKHVDPKIWGKRGIVQKTVTAFEECQ